MKHFMKWLLAPAVLIAGLAFVATDRAEAGRWWGHRPVYTVAYVHPVAYPYYPAYYGMVAPVRVRVYQPAPVVVYPSYGYLPVAPYYHGW